MCFEETKIPGCSYFDTFFHPWHTESWCAKTLPVILTMWPTGFAGGGGSVREANIISSIPSLWDALLGFVAVMPGSWTRGCSTHYWWHFTLSQRQTTGSPRGICSVKNESGWFVTPGSGSGTERKKWNAAIKNLSPFTLLCPPYSSAKIACGQKDWGLHNESVYFAFSILFPTTAFFLTPLPDEEILPHTYNVK